VLASGIHVGLFNECTYFFFALLLLIKFDFHAARGTSKCSISDFFFLSFSSLYSTSQRIKILSSVGMVYVLLISAKSVFKISVSPPSVGVQGLFIRMTKFSPKYLDTN
jgi:hypothetical protein